MELAQVTWGVLFGLPVRLLIFTAQPTLIPVSIFHDEPIVYLPRLETTRKVHRGDLSWLEGAAQYIFVHTMLEGCKYPICRKVAAPACFADFVMELDWVGFKICRRLSARPIVTAILRYQRYTFDTRSRTGCRPVKATEAIWNARLEGQRLWKIVSLATRGEELCSERLVNKSEMQ